MPERESNQFDFRIQRIEFPDTLNRKMIESWVEMPIFAHNDPKRPEWRATPVVELDIKNYGKVWIKDESDTGSNPTGTIKDRAAWEIAVLYRDLARQYHNDLKSNLLSESQLNKIAVPYVTVITEGNEGAALAKRFEQHGLPPPKLIISTRIDPAIAEALYRLRAEIFPVDLSDHALTTAEILKLSNNPKGLNITDYRPIDPKAVFYDWHFHEVVNEGPDNIFVNRGSGRQMESFLYWQGRTLENHDAGTVDPRLKIDSQKVLDMNIIGVEPRVPDSKASKLAARFRPFLFFRDRDVSGLVNLRRTGRRTQIWKVSEVSIEKAETIYRNKDIKTEPSGAADLGGYIEMVDRGIIDPNQKNLIVNSGSGLAEQAA